ncbi:MAG: M23 family metallopeptidase [Fibromonadaceae bacterium]|jgi:hypothetical protein|nr:M23 family metallopeptidase [Fibromonadaceae bacterium]
MGIDFSTNKEEGWPVIAPSDGIVEFASRGAFGYGRYIRFKARDQHVWLFAHLSEFSPRVDSLIRREMLRQEKPSVSLSLRVPFKKNDTLAYSGSTGIGNPHLHVERRTPDRKIALNPCKKMQCLDTIPPSILAAAPFDSGFAVKIVDYSREPLENPMSIYSLHIYQNRKLIFSKKYDSLSFAPADRAKIREDLIEVEDDDSVGDWHFVNVKIKENSKIFVVARDFANNPSRKELTLRSKPLVRKTRKTIAAPLDTVPPSIGTIYLKTDFAGKRQCRIPVLSSSFNFPLTDFRDENGKWVIFDYDSDPKELFVEERDFDFKEPLNIKLCSKLCSEHQIVCD